MAALNADRKTPMLKGEVRNGPVAATTKIFAGAIVMRNAAGYLTKGATATGAVGVGRAEKLADNSLGANGAARLDYRPGTFRYANSGGADAIALAEIGQLCYVVDDQTVAKTDGAATRSPAGIVADLDASGVWVRFDEALTRAAP